MDKHTVFIFGMAANKHCKSILTYMNLIMSVSAGNLGNFMFGFPYIVS